MCALNRVKDDLFGRPSIQRCAGEPPTAFEDARVLQEAVEPGRDRVAQVQPGGVLALERERLAAERQVVAHHDVCPGHALNREALIGGVPETQTQDACLLWHQQSHLGGDEVEDAEQGGAVHPSASQSGFVV